MPFNIGNPEATQGLTAAIYQAMDATLRPPIENDPNVTDPAVKAKMIQESQKAWKKLSFAIATGVVNYIKRDPANEAEYAQVFSSAAQDPAYWNWLAALAGALFTWSANPAANLVDLKNALNGLHSAHATPVGVSGVIQ